MSTILDALKRVEERIRLEAEQRAADGLQAQPAPAKVRHDVAMPAKSAASGDNDEVMEVYESIVSMLSHIQDQVLKVREEGRAETKSVNAEMAKALTALKSEFFRETEAIRVEFQKRNAERDADSAKLAESQAQADVLKKTSAETRAALAELLKTVTVLQKEVVRQGEGFQKEVKKRDTERDAGNSKTAEILSQVIAQKRMFAEAKGYLAELANIVTALQRESDRQREDIHALQHREGGQNTEDARFTALQSQTDTMKLLMIENEDAYRQLMRGVTALQGDSARLKEAFQKESQKRDKEREAENAALAQSQSRNEMLNRVLTETVANHAELAQTVTALRTGVARQIEAVQKEIQKRDAAKDAVDAKLAESLSQTVALNRLLTDTRASHGEMEKTLATLQGEFTLQREMMSKGFQKRDAELEAAKARLAESQTQNESLAKLLVESKEHHGELLQNITALREESVSRVEALREELQKGLKERANGKAKAADAPPQDGAQNKLLAETQKQQAQLAKNLEDMQKEFASQLQAVQGELREHQADVDVKRANSADGLSADELLRPAVEETKRMHAELTQTVRELREEFSVRIGTIQKELQERQAAEEGQRTTSANAAVSQDELLNKALDETTKGHAQLAQAVGDVQKELTERMLEMKTELQERLAQQEANHAKLADSVSLNESLKGMLSETTGSHAELVQVMDALRNNFARQIEGIQKQLKEWQAGQEAKQDARHAESPEPDIQSDAVEKLFAGTTEAQGALAEAVNALKSDLALQRETFQEESRRRDAQHAAAEAALGAMQSQTEALRQLVSNCESAVAQALSREYLVEGTDSGEAVRHEAFPALQKGSGETKPKTFLDKDEALRLHGAAGKAYERKDYSGALHLLDMIDEAFPRNKSVLHNRAQCLIALGRNDEARELCDFLVTVLKHTPSEELKSHIKD